jgi:striatin 1/3/4
MAWQSLSGMGGGGNGGGNGSQDGSQQQGNQPQGTEYTLQGGRYLPEMGWEEC